ncbi:CDGSH iron-sulfur domain-containing protein [Clostridia bacterium]|nr:CDGSH iron-sulfur domain-containing protein [Clostridia bacterium]
MNKKPKILTVNKGPLVIQDLESIHADTGREVSIDTPVALCRCGGSENSPFCDGNHAKINFNDEKAPNRIERKKSSYIGHGITIHDDRGICSHAGFCTDELPKVFRMHEEPWIDPDAECVEKIIETIRKCPSGALSYSIDGTLFDEYSEQPSIKTVARGPYYVSGSVEFDHEDELASKEHYAVCRCGSSKNKPFCSGEHWYIGYDDTGLIRTPANRMHKKPMLLEANEIVHNMVQQGVSENTAMSTLQPYDGLDTVLFKAAQLNRMPLNEDVPVKLATVIGKNCRKPLRLSLPFYISHMSYGAISKEAKKALAVGSSIVDTAICSGEGGYLALERENAKHYIYELGTAEFSHDEKAIAKADAVEIKIGQGVKPGVGGHLPAEKVTEEIAKIRHLKPGQDSVSPGRFSGIDTIDDLIKVVNWIREINPDIPVGIKIATGQIEEDIRFALKAKPDFITIDCRGGATGSSPGFLKDNVGVPAIYAIPRAKSVMAKEGAEVSLVATGSFRTSADIAKGLALGADAIALATASLIGIGCIQARVCHTGKCPVGIATQDEKLRTLLKHEKSVNGLVNLYNTLAEELRVFCRVSGKRDIHKMGTEDLMSTSETIASAIGITS